MWRVHIANFFDFFSSVLIALGGTHFDQDESFVGNIIWKKIIGNVGCLSEVIYFNVLSLNFKMKLDACL